MELGGRAGKAVNFLYITFPLNKLEKHLHIVCLDVPFPVDYGGVFDLFYKIVSLHKQGVKIHLHCFEYGRGQQEELNKYCESVHYYPRRQGHKGFSFRIPYIVSSRINETLMTRLLADDHPILLEGIHCSWPLMDPRFAGRKMVLRLHNVEYRYYSQLARSTWSPYRKLYYWHESRLLRSYEKQIAAKAEILAVTDTDAAIYRKELGATNCRVLPVFLPFKEVNSKEGVGCFCLYHGNLSVPENDKAATYLLEEVFNDINIPLVIAGKSPSPALEKLAHRQQHTCLVGNPGWDEMQDMITKAQINIIPSFVNTGIKLKLLNVLYNGRHCVVNDETVKGTGLEAACHSGMNAAALKSLIVQLYHQPYGEEEIRLRKLLLEAQFQNERNAQRLITWLW